MLLLLHNLPRLSLIVPVSFAVLFTSMSVPSSQSPRLMEALVDFSGNATDIGKGVTDDPNIAQDFAQEIYNKSFYLSTECTLCDAEPNKETVDMDLLDSQMTAAHGQAGYIRIDNVPDGEETREDEPVASFCVTAKHNLSIHTQAQPDGTVLWALPDRSHRAHASTNT